MIAIMSSPLVTWLSELAQREQQLAAAHILFRAGDPVRSLFLIVAGTVRLTRPLPHGSELTLQRAGPGAILAEASLFADRYHCEGKALEDSVVRVVPMRRLLAAFAKQPELARAWTQHLAHEIQRARTHAEIASLKTVSARIDAWMMMKDEPIPPKGQWRQVAAEIGVTPEALYRELARRRRHSSAP
ncbi:Crp/Fnr family transcriptional regulator [Bradyrhizobium sp. 186]|uniref:Crp/Fnr family transcriptional regulator n=1 Tax=Bradyrhizobium sp. 186 TaxID=2782654 RepID=UPI00200116F6|nr:Crp/Fnr family transcriptional regulator [Bradyrhizobium sp. 186]UPK35330.1 Crp/Fnr family transcriptional regulator [Bradyrhizobium sp. 186]